MTDASILCWSCHTLVNANQSECPLCKAGIPPSHSDEADANARVIGDQRALRSPLVPGDTDDDARGPAFVWDRDPVEQPAAAVVVQAKHASGLGLAPKTNVSLWFAEDQVRLVVKVKDGGSTAQWMDAPRSRSIMSDAAQVGYVSIEPAGTKSNIGAIAMFGRAGSRRTA
jgi:hypothetical protein